MIDFEKLFGIPNENIEIDAESNAIYLVDEEGVIFKKLISLEAFLAILKIEESEFISKKDLKSLDKEENKELDGVVLEIYKINNSTSVRYCYDHLDYDGGPVVYLKYEEMLEETDLN